jgi:hypothetical protein
MYPVVCGRRVKSYVWVRWTSSDAGGFGGGELRTSQPIDARRSFIPAPTPRTPSPAPPPSPTSISGETNPSWNVAQLSRAQSRHLERFRDPRFSNVRQSGTPTCGLHPTTTLCAVEVAPSPVNGAIRDQASNFAYIAANTAYRNCTKRELIPTAGDNPVHNHTAK